MPESELERLRAENSELQRRMGAVEATIAELRVEALQRRAEVRSMAEALPVEVSRHALVRAALRDATHHPDKRGVAIRAAHKLGRAPAKAVRILTRRH